MKQQRATCEQAIGSKVDSTVSWAWIVIMVIAIHALRCTDIEYPNDLLSKNPYNMSGGLFCINDDAAFAYSQRVNLFSEVPNATGMRFRNDRDPAGAWMPYAGCLEWVLPLRYGTNTISGEYKNSQGDVVSHSDSIFFVERLVYPEGQYIGGTVDISSAGDVVVAGSYEGNANAVVTFRKAAVDWDINVIMRENIGMGDQFGYSVAVSGDGNWLFAGAPRDDGGGSVYVYRYANGSWVLFQKLSMQFANGLFGYAVDASYDGRYCAVAAYSANRVFVFRRDNGVYALMQTWEYGNPTYALSVRPNACNLLVGIRTNNGGSVYVYTLQESGYTLLQVLNSLSQAGADGGSSLGISTDGSCIAVGVPYYDVKEAYDDRGAVVIYKKNGTGNYSVFTTILNASGNRGDAMGRSLVISNDGTRLVVALPLSDNEAVDRGLVRVYALNETLDPVDEYLPPDKKNRCYFGFSIAEGGGVIAIGAPFTALLNENDNRGMVYIRRMW
jgi:hypothetical protein